MVDVIIKDIISYDRNGFIINGKREFLVGGEFHYFRVPAALWEDRLKKMKALGANLISVYIAWNMHEPEEGF
jgi:beta-galactosidase